MANSTIEDIKKAILEAINEDRDGELRDYVMSIPGKVEETVRSFTPVGVAAAVPHPGRTLESIEVKSRRTEYKRLSTRKIKIGEVYSDDDHERVGAIEYGRHGGNHGTTEGKFMFARAADVWNGDGPE